MKKLFICFLWVLIAQQIKSQTIQEIATGAGYQKQSYINLTAGTEKLVNNTAWDIAFTVFGQQDAGIFINESSGSSMGQPLPTVELFDALTDNFDLQPDPTFLVDFQLFNSEKSWNYGAFNELRDPTNALDYGWGAYNFATNQVVGDKVYVLKLRNGAYKKIKIESLVGTTYTFKYANLDGTGLQTVTVNKAANAGKLLAYFNLETNAVADVEPATGGFDLLYCRYITTLYDPGTMTNINYNVTGILHGYGATVAEADEVDPATVTYAEYQDSLRTELDIIGHDWKAFSGTAWSVDENRVFFLKTANSRVWKLHFIDFEGSTTGKSILEKTDLGIISAVQDPVVAGLGVLTYPNPVQDLLTVALDIPAAFAKNAQLEIVDMQGRVVLRQSVALTEGFRVFELPAATWAPGMYQLRMMLPAQEIKLGRVVKL